MSDPTTDPTAHRLRRWLSLGQAVLLVAVLALLIHQIQQRRSATTKVLIIHAYHTNLPWVGDVNQGIDRALARSDEKIAVRRHYMNLLNHPDCRSYRRAAEEARLAVEDWKPDALVVVDDMAQALAGFPHLRWKPEVTPAAVDEVRRNLRDIVAKSVCQGQTDEWFGLDRLAPDAAAGGAPVAIFFAGINGDSKRYGYDLADNVTGIYEHKNYDALAETLATVSQGAPQRPRAVQVLNDASGTALAESSRYPTGLLHGLEWLKPINAATFAQWRDAVDKANKQGAMLLVANYQSVRGDQGELVADKTLVNWTETHAQWPVVGAHTNFVADGGMMTLSISGSEQGDQATELLLEYLRTGRIPAERRARQFLVGLNPSVMRQRRIELPAVYEAFARELGRFAQVSEHIYRDTAAPSAPAR